ncbi:MAG: hypothetical protein AAGF14_04090 [Pseudomonadota bacterium]
MNIASAFDRLVVRGLALCLLTTLLAGCMATAATTVVSQTVKTTAKAAGTTARVTMNGARVASGVVAKPFRKDQEKDAQ